MTHKQTCELSENLIFPRSTDNEGRCDKAERAVIILESHPSHNVQIVMGIISYLRLYSHWVSGSLLVRNTSRLPHLGWLVCKGKTERGGHYSSLLLLASDEALNPVCLLALRGHWENNRREQHEG